jgi:hypothetical protein
MHMAGSQEAMAFVKNNPLLYGARAYEHEPGRSGVPRTRRKQ